MKFKSKRSSSRVFSLRLIINLFSVIMLSSNFLACSTHTVIPTAAPSSDEINEIATEISSFEDIDEITVTQIPSRMPTKVADWCPIEPIKLADSTIRVAYVDESWDETNGIYVWDYGSDPFLLVPFPDVFDLVISDDGDKVLFLRGDTKEAVDLWVTDIGSGQTRMLVSSDDLQSLLPSFSGIARPKLNDSEWVRGSDKILFNIFIQQTDNKSAPSVSDIWLLDIRDGEIQNLGQGEFEVSPDSSHVLIYGESGVHLCDLAGNVLRENIVPGYGVINEHDRYYFLPPSWSHDSDYFLMVRPDTNDTYNSKVTFDLIKIFVEDIPPIVIGSYEGFAASVRFSPDNKFINYQRYWEMNPGELHFVNLETNENISYVSGDGVQAGIQWSPNGIEFIYHVIYDMYLGNLCLPPSYSVKLPYLNSSAYYQWAGGDLFLVRTIDEHHLFFSNSQNPELRSQFVYAKDFDFVVLYSE